MKENVNKVIAECMRDRNGLLGDIRCHMVTMDDRDADPYRQYWLYRMLQWSYWAFAGMVSIVVASFPQKFDVGLVLGIFFGAAAVVPLHLVFWGYAKKVLPSFWRSNGCFKSIEDLAEFLFPGETIAVKVRRLHHSIGCLLTLKQMCEERLAQCADNVIDLEHDKGRMCGKSLMEAEKANINRLYEIEKKFPFRFGLPDIKKVYQNAGERFAAKQASRAGLTTINL